MWQAIVNWCMRKVVHFGSTCGVRLKPGSGYRNVDYDGEDYYGDGGELRRYRSTDAWRYTTCRRCVRIAMSRAWWLIYGEVVLQAARRLRIKWPKDDPLLGRRLPFSAIPPAQTFDDLKRVGPPYEVTESVLELPNGESVPLLIVSGPLPSRHRK